jgi:hypothetical protein
MPDALCGRVIVDSQTPWNCGDKIFIQIYGNQNMTVTGPLSSVRSNGE